MTSPRSLMALLVVLGLSAKLAESAIAAPAECTAADVGKYFCLDCKTMANCSTGGVPPQPTGGSCTVAGQACTVLGGIALCVPIDETECSCDHALQCDAYDPHTVLTCLSNGMIFTNVCPSPQTCVDGVCATDVCAGAPNNTLVVIKPICITAAYCLTGTSQGTIECDSGTYFDMDKMVCLPLPPVPCDGCSTGACPDKSDCSKWYICEGGVAVHEETCEDPTPDFDTATSACVPLGNGTCTMNYGCTYGLTTTVQTTTTTVSSTDVSSTSSGSVSTTTATESTAAATTTTTRPAECTEANVDQRYPYEGNCKMYWTCLQVSSGEYDYVASTCLGSYEFNPSTSYCDLPANVVPPCVSTP